MKFFTLIASATALFFVLPHSAQSSASFACSKSDPQTQIFEKYQSYTDDMIKRDCTYDMQRIEPNATQAKLTENMKRTSGCVRGVTRMREISQNYISRQMVDCLSTRPPSTCTEGANQADCLLGAGKLAASAQHKEQNLGLSLAEARAEMEELKRYQRLRSRGYQEDLAALRRMAPEAKANAASRSRDHLQSDLSLKRSKPTLKPGQGDSRGSLADARPLPGKMDTPLFAQESVPPLDSGITDAGDGYQPPAEIDARAGGAQTLSEYEHRLPYLIQEQERSLQRLQEFEWTAKTKQAQHMAAASQFSAQAANLFLSAEKFGVVDKELTEWKSANREMVQAEELKAGIDPSAAPTVAGSADPGEGSSVNGSASANEKARPEFAGMLVAKAEVSETEISTAKSSAEEPDSVLATFETRLTVVDPKAPVRGRSRLRDLLRTKLAEMKDDTSAEKGTAPAELTKEILAETEEIAKRGPASASARADRPGLGRLDVGSALEDIEAQLRELDFQAGILEAGSENLFARVSRVVKAGYKAGLVER